MYFFDAFSDTVSTWLPLTNIRSCCQGEPFFLRVHLHDVFPNSLEDLITTLESRGHRQLMATRSSIDMKSTLAKASAILGLAVAILASEFETHSFGPTVTPMPVKNFNEVPFVSASPETLLPFDRDQLNPTPPSSIVNEVPHISPSPELPLPFERDSATPASLSPTFNVLTVGSPSPDAPLPFENDTPILRPSLPLIQEVPAASPSPEIPLPFDQDATWPNQ